MNVVYKKYRCSKCIRIYIKGSDQILVTHPWWVSRRTVERFVLSKKQWIKNSFEKIEQRKNLLKQGTREDYESKKKEARLLVKDKLNKFNSFYNFEYKRVFIRNQSTLWGSCSSRKNLNFNFRIIFLPEHLQDYLIVHELCHLKQMNHSRDFWGLVAKMIPAYKEKRKELGHF